MQNSPCILKEACNFSFQRNYKALILTICDFSLFPFGFEGGIWVRFSPVPGHCILVTFYNDRII